MSVKIKKNTIIMTRGDTLNVKLSLCDTNGEPYIPGPYDQIRFALKKYYDEHSPLITKDIPVDTMVLRLESEDTKFLRQPGEYVYDIQLTMLDGTVDTVISNGTLVLEEEVD